jgi:hypothetical protein
MRVASDVLRSVVFLGQEDPDESSKIRYTDTGFLIGMPSEADPNLSHIYLVTSAHGANGLSNGRLFVRMNRKDGLAPYDFPSGEIIRWYYHPDDEFVDAAALPFGSPATQLVDFVAIPRSMFWMADNVTEGDFIGLGDETFVAGLFPEFTGTQRNSPLLHFGNLIGLPTEKVPIEIEDGKKGLADAYLVEVRSIKGLSGSPVFLSKPISVDLTGILACDPQFAKFYVTGQICFLGLMHGHWKYPLGDITRYIPAVEDGLHSGVALVVPARKIAEILDQPELLAKRKAMDDAIRRKRINDAHVPSRDSANRGRRTQTTIAPDEKDRIEIPIPTREQVEDVFKKATRKRKP